MLTGCKSLAKPKTTAHIAPDSHVVHVWNLLYNNFNNSAVAGSGNNHDRFHSYIYLLYPFESMINVLHYVIPIDL